MHCSALDLLTAIGDEEAGAVITDPPERFPVTQVKSVIREIGRVLRPGGGLVVMGSSSGLRAWERLARLANLHFMAEIIVLWDSGKPRTRNFGSLHSRILWFVKGGHRHTFNFELDPNQQMYSNVLIARRVPVQDRVHPSEKPIGITNFIISLLTNPTDLIVDPFCGSGTTLVSAELCDRPYVGCDTDEFAVRAAHKRVQYADLEPIDPVYLWANGVQHEV